MVFCYKIITDTPRRSGNVSPGRQSPVRKLPQNVPNSLTQLINSLEYENESILDSIPDREWRLLAAIARKKEDDIEREKLADQFRRLWEKEKEERELVEAETNLQYKQYLHQKREQERSRHELKRLQRFSEQMMKRGQLIDCIRHKDMRSQVLLASKEDKKISELLDRAIEEEARMVLAADRRGRQSQAEQLRRSLELAHTQQKAVHAGRKKNALLNQAAKRVAISNALSSWESALLRHEISALEASRRAHFAAHAALTEERSAALAEGRDRRTKRARRMAAVTAQMREDLRCGRGTVSRNIAKGRHSV